MTVIRRHRIALLAAPLLALGLISCGKKPQPAGLLDHVPADTPYVFAASEPLPEPLYGRLMALSEGQMLQALQDYKEMVARMEERHSQQGGDVPPLPPVNDTVMRVMDALAAELQGKFNAAGMGELGFKRDADSVIYGISLFPVLRTEISDPAKVEALFGRVEKRSGSVAPRLAHQGRSLRRIPLGERLVLIIDMQDKHLVAGLLPTADEQQLLPVLLGEERPEASLAASGKLAKLQKRYDYQGYGEGYLDFQALARVLTGQGGGAYDTAWQHLMTDMPHPSPACQGLINKLVAGVPRMAVGLTDVTGQGYGMTGVYETTPAVSSELQHLAHPRPLPGMGMPSDSMFSFGMDVDTQALREAIKTLMRFVAREGQGCEKVNPDAIQAALPKVDLMLGPMLGGVSGFYTELSELKFDPQTGQPSAVRGGLLLSVQDPRGMLAFAAMMNPALAQLDLPLDGTPVAVPPEQLPPDLPPLYVAAREGLLAVAVGEDAAQRAPALLGAAAGKSPMLLGVDYDMARMLDPIVHTMGMAADQLEANGQAQQAKELRDQAAGMRASSGGFGRIQMSLAPDANGLVLKQRVQLR
jgi:hypothetical protein